MLPAELIRSKRDGGQLTAEQIQFLVHGITTGELSDAQTGALAMAICLQGMTPAETTALTAAMTRSGEVMTWPNIDKPILDKHSTGGVGDKVSLVLAPIVAACGGAVPMISGRGLGHSGGTLDKLESIPGYNVTPSPEQFKRTVAKVGCAIIGQTGRLAPADRRLYAIRDATGTVESVPLITASILSKKLAAGLDALVMDVKVGSGAFMATRQEAQTLAESLVTVARGNDLKISALITDMDRPLGRTAGNALEVDEALQLLRGEPSDPRFREVTLALSAELLQLAGLGGRSEAEQALSSGNAFDRFERMVSALGGSFAAPLPRAPVIEEVTAPGKTVASVDTRALGLAVITLGGGRAKESDQIDPAVGLSDMAGPGDPADRLVTIHARSHEAAEQAAAQIRAADTLQDGAGPGRPAPEPVLQRID